MDSLEILVGSWHLSSRQSKLQKLRSADPHQHGQTGRPHASQWPASPCRYTLSGPSLQGMTDRVSVIQDLPDSSFQLIGFHDLRFDGTSGGNYLPKVSRS